MPSSNTAAPIAWTLNTEHWKYGIDYDKSYTQNIQITNRYHHDSHYSYQYTLPIFTRQNPFCQINFGKWKQSCPNSNNTQLWSFSAAVPSTQQVTLVQWQWGKVTQYSCLWISTFSLLSWEILRKSVGASWMEKWVSWLQLFVGHWCSSELTPSVLIAVFPFSVHTSCSRLL